MSAELSLVFLVDCEESFDALGVRYPFVAGSDEGGYHTFYIQVAEDFVHHWCEATGRIDTRCPCGAEVGYETDDRTISHAVDSELRIRRLCPRCAQPFEPRGRMSDRYDGFTGTRSPPLDGGGAYRFALLVDCEKGWARCGAPVISPELRELVARTIGAPVVDFGEFY